MTWDRTWVMGYRRGEVNLCFLLYQSICQLLQGFQNVIFWSFRQRFTTVLLSQVTSCVHEFFFCRTVKDVSRDHTGTLFYKTSLKYEAVSVLSMQFQVYFYTTVFICLMQINVWQSVCLPACHTFVWQHHMELWFEVKQYPTSACSSYPAVGTFITSWKQAFCVKKLLCSGLW